MSARSCWLAVVLITSALAQPCVAAASIRGVWATERTERGQAHIRIEQAGEALSGTIVWLSEPAFGKSEPPEFAGRPKTDRNNPDPTLRGRPILGLRLLSGLRPAGGSSFKGGTIYDPESGRTYRCRARLAEDGTLRFRGYIGVSLLGRTTTWTRLAE